MEHSLAMNMASIHFTNMKMYETSGFCSLNIESSNLHSCVMSLELEGVQLDTLGGTPAEAKTLQSRKKTREKKKTNKNLAFIEDNWHVLETSRDVCYTNAKRNGSCIQ